MLIHQRLKEQKATTKKHEPDYQIVDVNSVKTHRARSIGTEYISFIGLQNLGFKEEAIKLIELIIGRMVQPASEYATIRWAKELSAIDELLDISLNTLSHSRLYRLSDKLLKHQKERRRPGATRA